MAWEGARRTGEAIKRKAQLAAADEANRERLRRAEEIGKSLAEAATEEAGLRNRQGEMTKWRVARAAANPAGTARKLAKGASREAVRQYRRRDDDR